MITVITNPAQIITVGTEGENIKHGLSMNEIKPLYDHHLLIEDGLIKDFVSFNSSAGLHYNRRIEATGMTILPGLVECHTHSVFSGSRSDEFNQRLQGVSYEEIASGGGGINKTVESVRGFSFEKLAEIAGKRVKDFISQGVTTLEIKSGYGLDFNNEIKLLRLINYLNSIYPIEIVPTFLGAHVYPVEYKNDKAGYIKLLTDRLLPFIADNNLANFCDGFCESTAFSSEDLDSLFDRASELGFGLKLHTDQFNSIGGIKLAVKYKLLSVEHLEVITPEDINILGGQNIVPVLLPGVSFFLNYNYAPARNLINAGAPVALATDYNPGSSNIKNIPFIMSLAALKLGMTSEEIISAYTINSAAALNMNKKIGSLEINKNADLAILNTDNYRDIIYYIGENLNCMTVKNGEVIFKSSSCK